MSIGIEIWRRLDELHVKTSSNEKHRGLRMCKNVSRCNAESQLNFQIWNGNVHLDKYNRFLPGEATIDMFN